MYVGKRIAQLRKIKGMNLTELAQKSGVQIATLSRMENMKMIGTLESHINIARALGTDLTQLYSAIIKEENKTDIRRSPTITDVFVHSEKSSYEILTPNVLAKRMMPILLKIEPGGQTNTEQNPSGSEKFVYILEGAIEVRVDKTTYPLTRYHALYFNASLKHKFINKTNVTAKVICVSTPVVL